MDFFINKDSNLPYLRVALIEDGRYDWSNFHEKIQNSDIRFSMYDIESGLLKICNKKAFCELKTHINDTTEEYHILYKWDDRDTKDAGSYIGKFSIEFLDNNETLIVPIREDLNIHIKEGKIKK